MRLGGDFCVRSCSDAQARRGHVADQGGPAGIDCRYMPDLIGIALCPRRVGEWIDIDSFPKHTKFTQGSVDEALARAESLSARAHPLPRVLDGKYPAGAYVIVRVVMWHCKFRMPCRATG